MIEFELRDTEEARKQIAFADIVLINKCDTVREGYVDELKELLQNINPFASLFSGDRAGGYPLAEMVALTRADFNRLSPVRRGFSLSLNGLAQPPRRLFSGNRQHHHHDITSLSFVFDRPFDLLLFERRLFVFLHLEARDVYRVKGILWVSGTNHKVVMQSVVNLMELSPGEEWAAGENRKSRLVIIGKKLQSDRFRKMLEPCLDKSFAGD